MISNYQRLLDGYLAGRDPEELAKASQIVNSGFDAPILDIGFGPRLHSEDTPAPVAAMA